MHERVGHDEGRTNLPVSTSANLDSIQLCFNKAHFDRRDFNLERFVNLARRRASLDVIHNDLRVYLRFLQNSMIELINDDYADFVNLSSSLAVLKESINKVSSGVESSWTSFFASTSEIQNSATLIQQKFAELLANRNSQTVIRNRISLLLSIERLSRSLRNRPASLSSWLPKLSHLVTEVELWNSRLLESKIPPKAAAVRQSCYSRVKKILIEELIADVSGNDFHKINNILQLLQLIGKSDVTISKVVSSCIAPLINVPENLGSSAMLTHLFDQLLQLRRKWIDTLEKQSQSNDASVLFLDRALLQFTSGFLDELCLLTPPSQRHNNVFLPSDPSLFHKYYELTANFVTTWAKELSKSPLIIAALKAIISKFNVVVYFKMITQQCQSDLKQHSKISEFSYQADGVDAGACRCTISQSVLTSLRRFYGDDATYLPVIADRLWDFTLKCLSNYADWVKLINEHFRLKGDYKSLENLVVLANDVRRFNVNFCQLYADVIKRRFVKLGVADFASMDACISIFSARMDALASDVMESVVVVLSTNAINELTAISEVPRQYRWTRKPAPTCFSPYLNTAFTVCENFSTMANRFSWADDDVKRVLSTIVHQLANVFCEKAEKVLESVEQTGTSLQRFRRKVQQQGTELGGTPGSETDTDEAKIRSQLAFDVSFMQQRAVEHGVDVSQLKALSARIAQTDAQSDALNV